MVIGDLGEFIRRLESEGELHRVRVEVDPFLEVSQVTDRVSKMAAGGKALLFERVKGSRFPLATNLFGSRRRICLALGIDEPDDLSRRMERFLDGLAPGGAASWWNHLGHAPRLAGTAPCHEVVEYHPDLTTYPFITSWPGDSGPAATLPLVCSRDPGSGTANCGIYRLRILDRNRAAVHWQPGSGAAAHQAGYRERGERMPLAVVVGADPVTTFAAMLPLPREADEMGFSGLLRGAAVEQVRCLTVPLTVPARSEMVIEGFIAPEEVGVPGVFGNHSGFYAPAPPGRLLEVTCVTRKCRPVIPATLVGAPPMEDCLMAKAAERLMLPFIRAELPQVVDLNLPMEWIFHNGAVLSIRKAGAGDPARVMERLRAGNWLRRARLLVVVDGDVDVHDLSMVAWRVINNVDWRRDLSLGEERAPGDDLPFRGGFLGIDATRKSAGERGGRPWPREVAMDERIRLLVDGRWRDYGF